MLGPANGRVYRPSGPSTLVELEAPRMGVQGKHHLWRALVPVAAESDQLDASRLQDLMTGQRTRWPPWTRFITPRQRCCCPTTASLGG